MFENTRCLDLSNATVISLFAMLCGTNTTTKVSSNCLRRRHPRPLTCIYGKSNKCALHFYRLSPYLAFAVVTRQLLEVLLAERITCGDLDNAMAPKRPCNDDICVDLVAAKRYKFASRCELILIRERNGRRRCRA